MINPFFKNNGPFKIDKLLKLSNIKNIDYLKNIKVKDIKDLSSATTNDITFFHSKKYESIGGEVINIGKPFKPIFDEAIKNIEILGKGKCTSTIVIGDGIDTDIKGANDYKLDSLLTLGGLFSGQKIDEVLKVIDNKKIFPSFLIEKLIY